MRSNQWMLVFALVCSSYAVALCQTSITTFILVRHAEKVLDNSEDPPLLPEGEERAKRLISILAKTKVDAIYSTKFKRTTNTVTPLAKAKGLNVKVYDPFKESPIDDMLRKHAGGTIVISGHSNNIPWIANLLAGNKDMQEFDDSDYGNLVIVDVVTKGKASKLTVLRY